jgi:hypothetical protein
MVVAAATYKRLLSIGFMGRLQIHSAGGLGIPLSLPPMPRRAFPELDPGETRQRYGGRPLNPRGNRLQNFREDETVAGFDFQAFPIQTPREP